MIKKLTLTLLSFGFIFVLAGAVLPTRVGAVDIIGDVCNQPTGGGDKPSVCVNQNAAGAEDNVDQNPLFGRFGIVTRAVRIIALVLGIIVIFVLLINAVRMITSSGDPQSAASARNGIIFAMIGAVIALSAELLVRLVLARI